MAGIANHYESFTTTAFEATGRSGAPVAVVRLAGELDICTAAPLSPRLDALTSPTLVLDLRGLTFLDCTGLDELCRIRLRMDRTGGRLLLAASSRPVQRLLQLTGMTGAFESYADVEGALAAA